ncbi:MAG: hypothetical protein QOI03_1168 [Solirubrobacteraceae bacterium]|nr:hypothetical protein [Solirubrobacteraceae bacterium]
MSRSSSPREVVILVYPGVQSLDVTGPLEVFAGAQQLIEASGRSERGYRVSILARSAAPVRSSSGLELLPHGGLSDAPRVLDTLIVPGGPGHERACADEELLDWISRSSTAARRTVSVCTGAFLLARAGLLDGRRASTHWAAAEKLARAYPQVMVDPEPIFVRDGSIWTSAGVCAGMDLALALVEQDLGRECALIVARHLVLFLRRPGGQSQFSAALAAEQPQREPLREATHAIVAEPAAEHTVEALATRANMSARHFARAFRAETGVTPARYVERVRLEAARRLLEEGAEPIAAVAAACGFGCAETMRRVFLRTLQVGPAEYRRRFQAIAAGPRAA